MKIRLISVPFDSGYRERRMGAGPRRVIESGALERLQRDGFQVEPASADPESSFTTEIGTAFELQRQVAALVGGAIADGAFPLILPSNAACRRSRPGHLRKTQAITEIIALMSNIVVIGKNNLKPGRSMTMSPGRRNSGNRLTQDQASPSRMTLAPSVTSRRFMRTRCRGPSDKATKIDADHAMTPRIYLRDHPAGAGRPRKWEHQVD